LRREGDADDEKVLKFEESKSEISPLETRSGDSPKITDDFIPEIEDLARRGEKRKKNKKINWKLKKPSKKSKKILYFR